MPRGLERMLTQWLKRRRETDFPRGEETDSEHLSPYTSTTRTGSELHDGGDIDGTSKEEEG